MELGFQYKELSLNSLALFISAKLYKVPTNYRIRTSDFILDVIYEEYKIPLLHEAKSVFLYNNSPYTHTNDFKTQRSGYQDICQ
jgi:hypothetical protein